MISYHKSFLGRPVLKYQERTRGKKNGVKIPRNTLKPAAGQHLREARGKNKSGERGKDRTAGGMISRGKKENAMAKIYILFA
jgi:hypothetical protein